MSTALLLHQNRLQKKHKMSKHDAASVTSLSRNTLTCDI